MIFFFIKYCCTQTIYYVKFRMINSFICVFIIYFFYFEKYLFSRFSIFYVAIDFQSSMLILFWHCAAGHFLKSHTTFDFKTSFWSSGPLLFIGFGTTIIPRFKAIWACENVYCSSKSLQQMERVNTRITVPAKYGTLSLLLPFQFPVDIM